MSVGTYTYSVNISNNAFIDWGSSPAILCESLADTNLLFVARNSFLTSDRVAVSLQHDAVMVARYNYWGTTDPAVIDGMIFDRKDDLRLRAEIPYVPYLVLPDPSTPDPTAFLTRNKPESSAAAPPKGPLEPLRLAGVASSLGSAGTVMAQGTSGSFAQYGFQDR